MLAGTSNDPFVPIPKGKKKVIVGSLEPGEVAYTVGYGDIERPNRMSNCCPLSKDLPFQR